MSRKKILIVNPIALFPKVMASQDRVFNTIKKLSKDHIVDVITYIRNNNELLESQKKLKNNCNEFYPISAINPTNNFFKRKYIGIKCLINYYLFGYPGVYFYNSKKYYLNKILETINDNHYNIVQVEYWYLGKLFERLNRKIYKVIDTHDVLSEKKKRHLQAKYGEKLPYFKNRELNKYEELEKKFLNLADLIISISKNDYDTLRTISPHNDDIIIHIGQNIDYFKYYETTPIENVILFYGSMSSDPYNQNVVAFFRFWNKILPLIKRHISDVKVLVVGANPPESIKKLDNGKDVIITGYVEDVREYLAKASLMILPLEIAAGFRSRVIEVMAMRIPIIGTRNALDSIEIVNGVHGYITDSNEEMAKFAIELLNNEKLRQQMGSNCRNFVKHYYTIEATYGKLSNFYSNLDI